MVQKGKYSFLERLNINNAYNMFLALPPERQTIALIGAVIVLVFIVLLPVSLASGKIGKMEKMLNKNRDDMSSIVTEIDNFNTIRDRLKQTETSLETGFDTALSTTLENLASTAEIKENIESIKERPIVPSELFDESIVDVRISKVTLEQLVDFLYSIEYARDKLLRVKEVQMRTRFDNRQLFDVSFQVSTYRLQKEG